MRFPLLVFVPVCFALFAKNTNTSALPLINRFHEMVLFRFRTPDPDTFGMSRMTVPRSMGQHFQPLRTYDRDFVPENDAEREVISKLEDDGVQVGLYVYGRAVLTSASDALNYRALKGPGAITSGTPRPAWYPGQPPIGAMVADALPDWKAVYPLAKRAMRSFDDGGAGFETTLEGWNIAARPVEAEARCNVCHIKASAVSKSNQPIGGVLYAFRHKP